MAENEDNKNEARKRIVLQWLFSSGLLFSFYSFCPCEESIQQPCQGWGKVVFLGHTLKEIRFDPEDHRSEFSNEQGGPVKKRKKEEHREILDTK